MFYRFQSTGQVFITVTYEAHKNLVVDWCRFNARFYFSKILVKNNQSTVNGLSNVNLSTYLPTFFGIA